MTLETRTNLENSDLSVPVEKNIGLCSHALLPIKHVPTAFGIYLRVLPIIGDHPNCITYFVQHNSSSHESLLSGQFLSPTLCGV